MLMHRVNAVNAERVFRGLSVTRCTQVHRALYRRPWREFACLREAAAPINVTNENVSRSMVIVSY